jgi:hypothetical protein
MSKTIKQIFDSQFPQFKIYSGGRFVASCKRLDDAAMIATCFGEETTVRYGHGVKHILWDVGAAWVDNGVDSLDYDRAASTMLARLTTMVGVDL